MTGGVVPSRNLRALLVDVGPTRQGEIAAALEDAGWTLHAEVADGTDALSAALARRGWDVVIYGGEGIEPVPARKAMALVRVADPQLPFVAAVPSVRPGDLSAFVQGFGPEAIIAPDPARLPEVLEQVLTAAHDARADADLAHRLLLAQQAITDHVAAGPAPGRAVPPRAGDARRDARLDLRRRLAAGRRVGDAPLTAPSGTTPPPTRTWPRSPRCRGGSRSPRAAGCPDARTRSAGPRGSQDVRADGNMPRHVARRARAGCTPRSRSRSRWPRTARA